MTLVILKLICGSSLIIFSDNLYVKSLLTKIYTENKLNKILSWLNILGNKRLNAIILFSIDVVILHRKLSTQSIPIIFNRRSKQTVPVYLYNVINKIFIVSKVSYFIFNPAKSVWSEWISIEIRIYNTIWITPQLNNITISFDCILAWIFFPFAKCFRHYNV